MSRIFDIRKISISIAAVFAFACQICCADEFSADINPAKTPQRLESEVKRPEPLVFAAMRTLAQTPVGQGRLRLRKLQERFIQLVEENSFKPGRSWISPEAVSRKRARFLEEVSEVNDKLDKFERIRVTSRKPDEVEAYRRYLRKELPKCRRKLLDAAKHITDPLLQDYYTGFARLIDEDYREAERYFTQCIDAAPLVVTFYQARGYCRYQNGDILESAADYTKAVALKPERQSLWGALSQVLGDISLADTVSDSYTEGKKLLDKIAASMRMRNFRGNINTDFEMPGGRWTKRPGSLPVPNIDAYFFDNAVGVVISESGLIITDSAAIKKAFAIYIEIPSATGGKSEFIAAARQFTSDKNADDLPFYVIKPILTDRKYAPVEIDQSDTPDKSGYALVSTGLYSELDEGKLRRSLCNLSVKIGGDAEISPELMPGETMGFVLGQSDVLTALVTGKTDIEHPTGGESRLIYGTELSDAIATAIDIFDKSSRSKSSVETSTEDEPTAFGPYIIHCITAKSFRP